MTREIASTERSNLRQMVWNELTDHLEVLYGAVAALVIVLLLTPAVGGARATCA